MSPARVVWLGVVGRGVIRDSVRAVVTDGGAVVFEIRRGRDAMGVVQWERLPAPPEEFIRAAGAMMADAAAEVHPRNGLAHRVPV